jgi:hypothetical protein
MHRFVTGLAFPTLATFVVLATVVPVFAAGDACMIAGKYIGSASLDVTGSSLATSHFDITFTPTGVACQQGTFVTVARLQALGSQDSIDLELSGAFTVQDGFLFVPLPAGIIVLGEPALCAGDACLTIPITAAREGNPNVRFAGSMSRAAGLGE